MLASCSVRLPVIGVQQSSQMMFLRALISDQLFFFFFFLLWASAIKANGRRRYGAKEARFWFWFTLCAFSKWTFMRPTIRFVADYSGKTSRPDIHTTETPPTGTGSINNCKTWIRASSKHAPTRPKLKVFSEMFSHHDMLMPFERLKFFLSFSFSAGVWREKERDSSARALFSYFFKPTFLEIELFAFLSIGRRAVQLPEIPA